MSQTKLEQRKRRNARSRAKMKKSVLPRLLVFRSLKYMHAQLIDDLSGKTLVSAHDIKESSGTKIERASKVGTELAKKALEAKIVACIFDRNGYKYHGRVKALAEAARAEGLQF